MDRFIYSFFLIFPSLLYADASLIQISNLDETLVESVNVSGHSESGVMYHNQGGNARLDQLFIGIKNLDKTKLCVDIFSIDGKYKGRFQYVLKNTDVGLTGFNISSQHLDYLNTYKAEQLVVLAQQKNNCDNEEKNYVPASWGRPMSPELAVYLNVGGDDIDTKVSLYKKEKGKNKVRCAPLKYSNRVAYDTKCVFELSHDYNYRKTLIKTSKYGSSLRKIEIPIEYDN